MFVGSCLEEYIIALLTFVAGDGIGKDDFVGVADMGFAGCVGDGGGDVVFLFFQGLLSPFLNVDASENIIVFRSWCLKMVTTAPYLWKKNINSSW